MVSTVLAEMVLTVVHEMVPVVVSEMVLGEAAGVAPTLDVLEILAEILRTAFIIQYECSVIDMKLFSMTCKALNEEFIHLYCLKILGFPNQV